MIAMHWRIFTKLSSWLCSWEKCFWSTAAIQSSICLSPVCWFTPFLQPMSKVLFTKWELCSSSVRLLFVGRNAKIFNRTSCDGIKLKKLLFIHPDLWICFLIKIQVQCWELEGYLMYTGHYCSWGSDKKNVGSWDSYN